MSLLKNILKPKAKKSAGTKSKKNEDGPTIVESKVLLSEHRSNISSLKRKHERMVQLNGATCVTARSIKKVQAEIQRVKRKYPALGSEWQDTYQPQ